MECEELNEIECMRYPSNCTDKRIVQLKPERNQANARERDRTHSVNSAFSTLRMLIPTEPKDRKLSKIETLRLACSYISHLGTQLLAGPMDQPCLSNSIFPEHMRNYNGNRASLCIFCLQTHKKVIIKEINTDDQVNVKIKSSSSYSCNDLSKNMNFDLFLNNQF